jgi:hypothetical protein
MGALRTFWRSGLIGKIVIIGAGSMALFGVCCVVLAAVSLAVPWPIEQPTATPEPTPRLPPPIPPLPPPTFNACQEDLNPDAAPNNPVLIVVINKRAETVMLKNVGPDPVDLTGWHMCSIKGNQEHPISGTLAPYEQKSFPGSAGDIWANADNNNGSLYNAQGQLVSYWYDPDR